MEQLELLKQYQGIDAKVDELENVVRNSEVRRKLVRSRQYLLSSQDSLVKMESQAGELRVLYETVVSKHQGMLARYGQMEKEIKAADLDTPLVQVENLRRETQAVCASLTKLEKDLQQLMAALKAISEKIVKMAQTVPKAKKEYADMKKLYDEQMEEMSRQSAPFRVQLQELENSLDQALLKRYRNIKQNHVAPLAAVSGNRCTGCNMELPFAMMQRIKEGAKLLECENCGRILYVAVSGS